MLRTRSPTLEEAYLLPKLRYQFAEFLLLSSLKHLRILFLPTCVGLRYGFHAAEAYRLFLEAWYQSLQIRRSSSSLLSVNARTDLPVLTAYELKPTIPTVG